MPDKNSNLINLSLSESRSFEDSASNKFSSSSNAEDIFDEEFLLENYFKSNEDHEIDENDQIEVNMIVGNRRIVNS